MLQGTMLVCFAKTASKICCSELTLKKVRNRAPHTCLKIDARKAFGD